MKIFGKEIEVVDKKFRQNWGHYILQCLMATAAFVIILFVTDSMFREVMLASFGATAFLVFAMPHLRTSRFRSVLGGYVIGLIIGIALYHCAELVYSVVEKHWVFSLAGGLAIGLSLFLMTMTNTEHPPAAGLALGIVLQGYHALSLIIIFLSVLAILLIKHFLRNWLIDLY
ncbi:MAG: HPP family protein [Clostridia bacterium]|nr:HPP family protein [Clostridia bacterium]